MSRPSVQVRSPAPDRQKPRVLPGASLFVSCGTDTGVGKTWSGVTLLQELVAHGARVAASKPIESGVPEGGDPLDAAALAAVTGQAVDDVCRWSLPRPIAPARELERLGIDVPSSLLVDVILETTRGADIGWVETAGGVASPLTPELVSGDVPAILDAPAILVVPDTLGSIHQTSVSASWLLARGVRIGAILLNDMGDRDLTRENPRWIARAVPGVPVLSSVDELAQGILSGRIR